MFHFFKRKKRFAIRLVIYVCFLGIVAGLVKNHFKSLHEEEIERLQKNDLNTEAAGETKESKERNEFYVKQHVDHVLSTSVWCSGDRPNRVCKFKNLYYLPQRDRFIFVKSKHSTVINAHLEEGKGFLDLTSLSNHNAFFWDFVESGKSFIAGQNGTTLNVVPEVTFAFSRFHVGNIMHTMHDDVLGLYFNMKMYAPKAETTPKSDRDGDFSTNTNVLFLDGWRDGQYAHVFQYLTKNSLLFKEDIQKSEEVFCFSEIIVGNSKQANWYQYGFGMPQGPIANKTVDGNHVREVVDFIYAKNNFPLLPPLDEITRNLVAAIESDRTSFVSKDYYISIFSRRGDRLILNEEELEEKLKKRYRLPVKFIRLEDLNFHEQLEILSKTMIAVGMHGSLLIMSMFMPRNSILIEMFPLAVPAENYTPYKTLCSLKGVDIKYNVWVNTHEENNVPHPHRPGFRGGLDHLSEEERQKVLNTLTVTSHHCCSDPFWLFRIYQDTKVHVEELMDKIDMELKRPLIEESSIQIKPAPIENEVCTPGTQGMDPALELKWSSPWNGVKPSYYGIWSHQEYKEVFSRTNQFVYICERNSTYDFWIRPYFKKDNSEVPGEYGKKITCLCV